MSSGSKFWNDRYREEEYIYGIKPNDFLEENIHQLKPKSKILLLGEGEGRNAVYLSKCGFDVYAVDFSIEAKKKALLLAAKNNVKINYENCDLKDFEIDANEWDCIISIFCHTNSVLRKQLFGKIKAGLKKSGIFLLEAYNKEQIKNNTGGPRDFDMLFSADELREFFYNFKIITLENKLRNISEGIYHNGNSSVLQFIGLK